MSQSVVDPLELKSVGSGAYPLIEFPRGDFKDYYYIRQIWMAVVHVQDHSSRLTARI